MITVQKITRKRVYCPSMLSNLKLCSCRLTAGVERPTADEYFSSETWDRNVWHCKSCAQTITTLIDWIPILHHTACFAIQLLYAHVRLWTLIRPNYGWALDRVQTHALHSIAWNMFLHFVTLWPWPLTFWYNIKLVARTRDSLSLWQVLAIVVSADLVLSCVQTDPQTNTHRQTRMNALLPRLSSVWVITEVRVKVHQWDDSYSCRIQFWSLTVRA